MRPWRTSLPPPTGLTEIAENLKAELGDRCPLSRPRGAASCSCPPPRSCARTTGRC